MTTNYRIGVIISGSVAGYAKAVKDAETHTKRMGTSMGREFQRMAQARETLGIRPEREIQREIQKTQAAYNRLASSGKLSFTEQQRAAKAMREEVTKLTNEMGLLTKQQKLLRDGAGFVGAVVATGAYITPKARSAMEYDRELAHLANTAYNGRDKAGRIAGRQELDAQINDAVRYGGGNRDGALDAAKSLYGSGIFTPADVKAILREAVMAGTANDASSVDFAQLAISANQTMGISAQRMGAMFGMGTFAGQSGGFEIKDMTKHLPAQMAAANAIGMSGERGFARLAALNQASVVTAGTKDEAGNNVVNLLAKIGSQDAIKNFDKMGINLPKALSQGRMKGLDALDVVGNILQEQLAKDKNYQDVQKQLASSKNGSERQAALKAVGDIAQGTVIGQVFQDRQALMALYGFINSRDRVDAIANGALTNTDAAGKNMDVIRDTAGFKVEQAANARDIAFQQSMDKLTPAIGGVADGMASLMTEYPGYTTAIATATAALTGFAGAAGLGALATGGGAAGVVGRFAGMGNVLAKGGALGLAAGFGALIGTRINDMIEGTSAHNFIGESAARIWSFGGLGSQEATHALAVTEALKNAKIGGEVTLRVTGAPGLNVTTETKPFAGTRMNSLGQTNQGAGY